MKAALFVFAIASMSILVKNGDGRYLLLKLNEMETRVKENIKDSDLGPRSLRNRGTR